MGFHVLITLICNEGSVFLEPTLTYSTLNNIIGKQTVTTKFSRALNT